MRPPSIELRRGLALLLPLLAVAIAVAALTGGVPIRWSELSDPGSAARAIVMEIRLPRTIAAALVGAILAFSGSAFQTLLRNPLADPFILGVSGGAACAAAVATALRPAASPLVVTMAAFGGAVVAVVVVLAIAGRGGSVDPARLILTGLALNALFSAVILLALSTIAGADLVRALHWMMGGLSSVSWGECAVLALAGAAGLTLLLWTSGDLRLLLFGEDDAQSRGVEVERVKLVSYLAASLATASAVAIAGIVGFVGLLVPHLVRRFWANDHRVTLPLSALAGGLLLVAADTAARTVAAPAELPLGALTALLGVPFFLFLLRRAA